MDLASRKAPQCDRTSIPSTTDSQSLVQYNTIGDNRSSDTRSTGVDTDYHKHTILQSKTLLQNDTPRAYELSQDGKKRRRISQDAGLNMYPSLAPQTPNIGEDIIKQDVEDISGGANAGPVPNIVRFQQNERGLDKSLGLLYTSPEPRKRGRPSKAAVKQQLANCSAVKSADDSEIEQENRPIPNTRTTPRKAVMKLGLNGKLIEPRKILPIQGSPEPTTKRSPITSASRGKNLALRNGKLAQKLVVAIRYNATSKHSSSLGVKIDQIFSGSLQVPYKLSTTPRTAISRDESNQKSTHPFFLAKELQAQTSSVKVEDESFKDARAQPVQPVAWKDLGFKSDKGTRSKSLITMKPLWPPLSYHHIGTTPRTSTSPISEATTYAKHKSKRRNVKVAVDENILVSYAADLKRHDTINNIVPPQKLQGTAAIALANTYGIPTSHESHRAITNSHTRMLQTCSAFDKAEPSGALPWTQQYLPSTWEEVLQTTTRALFEWLAALVVHNVKQGLDAKVAKPLKRRKRPKKQSEEFYDFIVDFEEDTSENAKLKNAILIVGPSGCGKTASVFTVAKQLGFEIFEIHSGMRRSQKDIFEKVGDMTQNHMVQGGQKLSRESSILHDPDTTMSHEESNQPSLASFLAPNSRSHVDTSRSATPQPSKKSQKQSLILIEEVDQIFEDDKGFWSGVQTLISNSKRPVVLTCNDVQHVPLDELDLHTILEYTAPPDEIVAEYLYCMAAAEGHIIEPSAIKNLYASKGYDLRATITELQFWCQMAVGSTRGGLDWYPVSKPCLISDIEPTRTFSKDTFRTGLDLNPTGYLDLEDSLRFVSENLDIPCDDFVPLPETDRMDVPSNVSIMQQTLDFIEDRSDIACLDATLQPLLYSRVAATLDSTPRDMIQAQVTSVRARQDIHSGQDSISFCCLNALAVESSIYSLGQGRLAPSLDGPKSILAVDISPYVRSIATYDLELERQRDEVFSSQGKKTRTTRAARAAAEGGDKASTRRERWFSGSLDVQAVLATGNDWPQWVKDEDISDTKSVEQI